MCAWNPVVRHVSRDLWASGAPANPPWRCSTCRRREGGTTTTLCRDGRWFKRNISIRSYVKQPLRPQLPQLLTTLSQLGHAEERQPGACTLLNLHPRRGVSKVLCRIEVNVLSRVGLVLRSMYTPARGFLSRSTPKLTEGATQGPTPIVQPSGVDEQIESGKTRRQSHGHRRVSLLGDLSACPESNMRVGMIMRLVSCQVAPLHSHVTFEYSVTWSY